MSDSLKTEKAYWKRVCAMASEPLVHKYPTTYVAGPISPTVLHSVEENIDLGIIAGFKLLLCGYYPIIPHLLAREMGMEGWRRECWMELDLPVMLACDRVIFLSSWQSSPGAVIEYKTAGEKSMLTATEPPLWELIVHPGTDEVGLVDPFTQQFKRVRT